MGMHHGYVVAGCSWPALHARLKALDGRFTEVSGQADEGVDVVRVLDTAEATYMLEGSMILSADADLIIRLSEELACRVVGTGAETVSGTVWFTAAEAGEARRVYFNIGATLTQPFAHGEPLSHERTMPWEDLDGTAIRAGLAAFGFPPGPIDDLWQSPDTFAPSYQMSAPTGHFGAAITEHVQRFEAPDAEDWTKNIEVVRRNGGHDIVARPAKRSRLTRWFRRPSV